MASLGAAGCAVAPEDNNGNRPDDVVKSFIKTCDPEDYDEAWCARFKKIGLENCEISKARKGKAGFWHVEVDFEEGGEKKHVFFYFKIVDGEWRIQW